MQKSKKQQKIAFQGVAGAYSHIAAMEVFPGAEYLAFDTFEQAMEAAKSGAADLAMIPVENSNAGRVADVHFLLPEAGLSIVGEFFLRVEHQLLGLKNAKLKDIYSAISHPQALAQCSEFLKKHGIKQTARIDTAKSCMDVINFNDRSKAAIASRLAAEIYGLEVIAANIENASNNTTRFLAMAREAAVPKDDGGKFITSLVFRAKNIPAALYKALGGFATNGINLAKLESYLLDGRFAPAQFYAEIESHPARQAYRNAMEELRFFSESVQVLGTYKAGER